LLQVYSLRAEFSDAALRLLRFRSQIAFRVFWKFINKNTFHLIGLGEQGTIVLREKSSLNYLETPEDFF
jgi:hypothetical protein